MVILTKIAIVIAVIAIAAFLCNAGQLAPVFA